jgi:photosystem II stability/assembly factor-like uncharacterized protein
VLQQFFQPNRHFFVNDIPKFGALTALVSIFALTLLSACGGGSSSSGSRTQPPPSITNLTYSPPEPWKNGLVTFYSTCIGAGNVSYEWDMGDGTRKTTTDPFTSHSYLAGGDMPVSVTCTDGTNQKTRLGITVTVDPMDLTSVANRTCSTGRQGRGWCIQSPLPTAAHLNSVAAVDRVTFWAVGDNGSILKTIDGGAAWVTQSSKTTNHLTSISAVDINTAWAVGAGGTILKTKDGGRTWGTVSPVTPTSVTTANLYSVAAVDANTAWAVGDGGIILKTTDGETWKPQISNTTDNLTSISAVNARTAWAVSTNGVFTNSEGDTWQKLDNAPSYPNSIIAVDASTAWVSTFDNIYKTTDGGISWERKSSPPFTSAIYSIAVVDADTVWVAGENFSIYRITSDGVSWNRQHFTQGLSWRSNIHSIVATDAYTVIAVGDRGTILKTRDGGASWDTPNSGTFEVLYSIATADANTAWAVGMYGAILGTADGGASWEIQYADWSGLFSSVSTAVDSFGSAHAIAVAPYPSNYFVSNGSRWSTQTFPSSVSLPLTVSGFNSIATSKIVSDRTIWMVGASGTILKTTDGGSTWPAQTSGTTNDLNSISATDGNTAWSVGGGGTILRALNGSNTWDPYSPGSPSPLAGYNFVSIAAVDTNTAWAVGLSSNLIQGSIQDSRIVKVTIANGVASWETQTSVPTQLTSIAAVDARTAWAVGLGGIILKTTDGGTTWVTQNSGTANNLLSVAAVDANTAWVVGSDGLILKTLTGGE